MRNLPGVILTAQYAAPILDEVQLQDPQAGEVLVEMRASGICHTDLAAVRDARTYPILLGHEGAGVVAATGPGVSHLAVGDHVVINWQPKCETCVRCLSGRSDLCEAIRGTQTPRVFWRGEPIAVLLQAGTFCSAVVVPAAGAVRTVTICLLRKRHCWDVPSPPGWERPFSPPRCNLAKASRCWAQEASASTSCRARGLQVPPPSSPSTAAMRGWP